MGGNPIQFDFTILASILALLFPLLFIYFIVSAIRFFKRKEATDKELLQKLDELIKLQTQQTENKT
ncbi:hypothetical protein SAMN02746098_03723 [Desulfosporosinus lacus DSM 15449]|uniref:DUF4083 domain-containing protein n=1 Tax=Desulfosporosinus lacus DSM 15449 TaxID=1121420 RepID=A0A1M5ZVQ1_9FIRM|nr:hypothetical protein SAMN02746098_03723 [Desulfosporosinus lacus DSM 15449]